MDSPVDHNVLVSHDRTAEISSGPRRPQGLQDCPSMGLHVVLHDLLGTVSLATIHIEAEFSPENDQISEEVDGLMAIAA